MGPVREDYSVERRRLAVYFTMTACSVARDGYDRNSDGAGSLLERSYPLFYEYFHGDTGAGVGASHQTGWSGAIARIVHLFASSGAHEILEQGKEKSAGGTPQPMRKT